jgi:hypothetical protein
VTLNSAGILAALVDHSLTTGLFERVNGHEPKNAPGSGLSCALWCDSIGPARNQSGLDQTAGLLVFSQRIQTSMLSEPADDIDPQVLGATDAVFANYSGDFTLGGLIREIDLLGMAGNNPLAARAGYVNQDGKMFRVMTITIPMIIDALWSQAP